MKYIEKNIGETPLECLQRCFGDDSVKRSYAGRLDPMAEGLLLVLEGDECSEREKYLAFRKVYDYRFIAGIGTDTHDMLGMINGVSLHSDSDIVIDAVNAYVGERSMQYPAYSSKTVDGKPLHWYARNNISVEIPTRTVEIFSNVYTGSKEMKGKDIAERAIANVRKTTGDFRQKDIILSWEKFGERYGDDVCIEYSAKAEVSSGTYIRSIVRDIGTVVGGHAMVSYIRRTAFIEE